MGRRESAGGRRRGGGGACSAPLAVAALRLAALRTPRPHRVGDRLPCGKFGRTLRVLLIQFFGHETSSYGLRGGGNSHRELNSQTGNHFGKVDRVTALASWTATTSFADAVYGPKVIQLCCELSQVKR